MIPKTAIIAKIIMIFTLNLKTHNLEAAINTQRPREKLKTSCTIFLLHLSFLLEHNIMEATISGNSPEQKKHALIRANISQKVIYKTYRPFFDRFKQQYNLLVKPIKKIAHLKIAETFTQSKHSKMWNSLEKQASLSQQSCILDYGKTASKIAKAMLKKNYKIALKFIIPQIQSQPSNQLLYEWIQRLYVRAQRSPGQVTLEHLK